MSNKIEKICGYGFVLVTFALLLYRITLHADVNDEIMNLSIAYRMTMGDIPFYHIQESYQLGAIFLVPFVWLFVKLTGGTTGIVLYSRVVYIMVLAVCAILTYRLLRNYLEKGTAFFISYVIVFFELYSMFYLWYDTEALIFFLLGALSIVNALEQSKSNRQKYVRFALAGICHSCMAVAHVSAIPVALGVAVLIAVLVYLHYGKRVPETVKCVCAYAAFPLSVVLLAVIVLVITGNLGTIIAFLGNIIQSRLQIEFNLLEIILNVKDTYMTINAYLVEVTKVLLVVYVLTWIFPKLFPVLAFGMIVLPIYNQQLLPETSVRGLPNYIAYLALWAPLLYLFIKKKDKFDRCLFYIFVVPIFISAVFIPLFSMTSSYGPIKAWQMFLPGMLATLYYIAKIWKERVNAQKTGYCKFFYMIVSLTLLYNAYSFVYLCYPLIEKDNVRLTEGIYAGIKVNESMECMEEMQKMVEQYTDGCETILASSEIRCIYLMTDLKPFTVTTEMATVADGEIRSWYWQMEYFKKFNALPDIMFLQSYDLMDENFAEIKEAKYEFVKRELIGEHEIIIYKRIGI